MKAHQTDTAVARSRPNPDITASTVQSQDWNQLANRKDGMRKNRFHSLQIIKEEYMHLKALDHTTHSNGKDIVLVWNKLNTIERLVSGYDTAILLSSSVLFLEMPFSMFVRSVGSRSFELCSDLHLIMLSHASRQFSEQLRFQYAPSEAWNMSHNYWNGTLRDHIEV